MEDKISVIVPIYNVEKYLERCLDSIINQTYKNLEIILIDDGSIDNSGKICDNYAQKDHRIKVLHKENGGVSTSRNLGLQSATGKYIAFIDSDDFIDNKMLEILYKLSQQNNADIVMCDFEEILNNTEPNINGEKRKKEKVDVFHKNEAMKELLKSNQIASHLCNKLFKKELFNDIEFPQGKRFEDLAIMHLVFAKITKLVHINKKMYYYCRRSDSITKHIEKTLVEDYIYVSNQRVLFIKEKFPEMQKELELYQTRRIKNIHAYAALGNCIDIYHSEECLQLYNQLKSISKKNKIEIFKIQPGLRRKIELFILLVNRDLYYNIVSNLGKGRKI